MQERRKLSVDDIQVKIKSHWNKARQELADSGAFVYSGSPVFKIVENTQTINKLFMKPQSFTNKVAVIDWDKTKRLLTTDEKIFIKTRLKQIVESSKLNCILIGGNPLINSETPQEMIPDNFVLLHKKLNEIAEDPQKPMNARLVVKLLYANETTNSAVEEKQKHPGLWKISEEFLSKTIAEELMDYRSKTDDNTSQNLQRSVTTDKVTNRQTTRPNTSVGFSNNIQPVEFCSTPNQNHGLIRPIARHVF